MPRPTQPWDQSEDPRENTEDLPRVHLAGLADYFRGAAPPPKAAASAGPAEPVADVTEPSAGPAEPQALAHAGSPAEPRAGASPGEMAAGSGPAGDAPPGRSVPGSHADLRSRLSRLPAGHPSSPYDDSGHARPLPTRLKHLELGLPAPGREPGDVPASDISVWEPGLGAGPDPAVPGSDLPARAAAQPAAGAADQTTSPTGPTASPTGPSTGATGRSTGGSGQMRRAAAESDRLTEPPERGSGRSDEDVADDGRAAFPEPQADNSEPARHVGGQNGSGERADSPPPRPQWQDPYAVDSAGNGYPHDDSDAGIRRDQGNPAGPVPPGGPADLGLRPWTAENSGGDRRLANGAENGNGHHREIRPEPGRGDFGPMERNRRGPDRPHVWPLRQPGPDRNIPFGPDRNLGRDHNLEPDRNLPPDRNLRSPRRDAFDDRRPEPRQQDTADHRTPRGDSRRPDISGLDPRPPDAPRQGAPQPRTPPPGTSRQSGSRPTASTADAGALTDLVERTLTACRAAEGQTVFGGYGSSGLTPVIRRLADQLPAGGLAPGSEADSLKSAGRFAAKLAKLIARNPGRLPAELAAGISDAVRYAFAFEEDDYTECTWLVHRKLKTQGFELETRRNRWESPERKGIFTCWRDPAHGISFEVQFHTPASWDAVKRTHDAYVRITNPATPAGERALLRARQVVAASSAAAPPGCMEITDFQAEQR
ncbi:MAG TPA: hypothetical protein VKB62_12725 [Streptosporangiaceae bacterium]|nr:hypothetical protein [Streptosporangiaceae bacterium]